MISPKSIASRESQISGLPGARLNILALHVIIGLMDDLLPDVRRFARRYHLLETGTALVVGVSGGPDSLCLLHVLRRLAAELRLRLHVAHLNHGLRGAEAEADAAFVADLAAEWGLPCTVGRADVAALAEAGLSLEEAARHARYRFLAEVARAAGVQAIAVGHNLDDQAETVLMHFLRGSGVAGLRGMLPRTRLAGYRLSVAPADESSQAEEGGSVLCGGRGSAAGSGPSPWLVRPLLDTQRSAIEAYCAEWGLQPRFDRSNEDTTFYRNRLRHELLPLLAGYNPQIREVLAHTAGILAADYDVLRAELERTWDHVAAASADAGAPGAAAVHRGCAPEAVSFELAGWRALPLSLQRATVREAIQRLRSSLRNINWEHVERAVWLAREGSTGQRATLAAGLELRVGYTTLRIADEDAAWLADAPQVPGRVALSAPGTTRLAGGWLVQAQRLRADELPSDYRANLDPWTAYLDAWAVGPELVLRPRLPGEEFQPHGLAGRAGAACVRLAEFMINVKVPRDSRAGWPILAGRSGAAWVCGLRLDRRSVVTTETLEVWRVQLQRLRAGAFRPG